MSTDLRNELRKAALSVPRSQTAMTPTKQRFRCHSNTGEFDSPIKSPFQQPQYNHLNDLSVRECAGIKPPEVFGFEPF